MPRGDGTGPEGKGPKTGRGFGYCTGNEEPGYESNLPVMGMGRGPRNGEGPSRGMGFGPGRGRGREYRK
jgi:hypothetical protein